ncbi:hypothetical protein [Mycolicibacillus trivialis]
MRGGVFIGEEPFTAIGPVLEQVDGRGSLDRRVKPGFLSDLLAEENIGRGGTGAQVNAVLEQVDTLLTDHGADIKATVQSSDNLTRALVDYRRELAEVFNVAPLAVDNVANAMDTDNGMLRVGAHFDSVFFDSSMTKEVCNILGLRQLGCRTGTVRDMGPDFGVTHVLEGLTRLGEK